MDEKKKKYLALLYLMFLLLLYLISMLTHNWLKTDGEHIGLWVECKQTTGCSTMENTPSYDVPFLDWFSAVRSFMVLPCIFVFMAKIFILCNLCYGEYFRMKPACVAVIFCVIFLIHAIVIFAVEKRLVYDSSWSLDWSFYITCISLVFTIIGVVLLFKIKDEKKVKRKSRSYDLDGLAYSKNGNGTNYNANQNIPPVKYSTNQAIPMVDYSTNHYVPVLDYASNQNPVITRSFGAGVAIGDNSQLVRDGSSKDSKSNGSDGVDSDASSESGSDVRFV